LKAFSFLLGGLLSSFLSSTLNNAFALRLFLLFLSYSRLQLIVTELSIIKYNSFQFGNFYFILIQGAYFLQAPNLAEDQVVG